MICLYFDASSSDYMECSEHHDDKDVGAIEWDHHMDGVLEVISTPLSFLGSLLNRLNCVLRLLIKFSAPSEVGDITQASLLIPLLSNKVIIDDDLRTPVVRCLRLILIHYEGLRQQGVGDLGPHMLQVNEDGQDVDDQVATNRANTCKQGADVWDVKSAN